MNRQRWARAAVRLWPPAWREVYGEQLADDLAEHGNRTSDLLDVAWRGMVRRVTNRRPAAAVALAGGGTVDDLLAVTPGARATGAANVLLLAQAALTSGWTGLFELARFAGPARGTLEVLGGVAIVLAFVCCAAGVASGLAGVLVKRVRAEALGLLAAAPAAVLLHVAALVAYQSRTMGTIP